MQCQKLIRPREIVYCESDRTVEGSNDNGTRGGRHEDAQVRNALVQVGISGAKFGFVEFGSVFQGEGGGVDSITRCTRTI